MEELQMGPNGALLYCLEYLSDNFDWLEERLSDLRENDYVLFDCPGQIEILLSPVISTIVQKLTNLSFKLVSVYMLDITFVLEGDKFISGVLMALSAMMQITLPSITVLSKCDLVQGKVIKK